MSLPGILDRMQASVLGRLAEAVQVVSGPGQAVAPRGVFHHLPFTVAASDAVDATVTAPVLAIRDAEWSELPDTDSVLRIRGVHYAVIDVRPDGQAARRLVLRRHE